MGARRQHRRAVTTAPSAQDDLSGKHFRRCSCAQPVRQLVDHRPAAQPHPRRAQPVAYRQWRARLN